MWQGCHELNHLTIKLFSQNYVPRLKRSLLCCKISFWETNISRKAAEYLDDKQIEEDMEVPIDRWITFQYIIYRFPTDAIMVAKSPRIGAGPGSDSQILLSRLILNPLGQTMWSDSVIDLQQPRHQILYDHEYQNCVPYSTSNVLLSGSFCQKISNNCWRTESKHSTTWHRCQFMCSTMKEKS